MYKRLEYSYSAVKILKMYKVIYSCGCGSVNVFKNLNIAAKLDKNPKTHQPRVGSLALQMFIGGRLQSKWF